MNVADEDALTILVAARAKIAQPEDWGQGVRSERKGTFCVAEAIEVYSSPTRTRKAAYRALAHAAGIDSKELCNWNDAPERTHAEVLAAFDLAIATLRLK